MSMTEAEIEARLVMAPSFETSAPNNLNPPFKCIFCIHYLVWFKKDQAKVQTLIDSSNEINAMTLAYIARLGLKIRPINIGTQKLKGSNFKMFEMVIASFQIDYKLKRACFFQETFLVANTSVMVNLAEALPTTK